MTRQEFERQRREVAEKIAIFEQELANSIASELRLMDEEQRISAELHTTSQVDPVRKRYLDTIYRILSFGSFPQRLTIIAGSEKDVNNLVETIQSRGGFTNDTGYFVEVCE